MTRRDIVVPVDLDGERADKILASALEVSRAVSREIIDAGGATIGDRAVAPSDRLRSGQRVTAVMPEPAPPLVPDPSVPIEVAYEDADLVVLDKPAGIVVHPTSPRSESTLVHGLLARFPQVRGVGQEDRWGIVHRLDKDTSGLLVVALSVEAYAGLSAMMRLRQVHRRYLTLVHGTFDGTLGTIDAPMGRDRSNPMRMGLDRDGRPAQTHYRRLASWQDHGVSYLSVELGTGRTHQIRVHMQSIGHPIVGDRTYGRAGTAADPGRPWLHARQLAFTHPVTGDAIDVVSPLPADLADSLALLGEPDIGSLEEAEVRRP